MGNGINPYGGDIEGWGGGNCEPCPWENDHPEPLDCEGHGGG